MSSSSWSQDSQGKSGLASPCQALAIAGGVEGEYVTLKAENWEIWEGDKVLILKLSQCFFLTKPPL